MHILFAGPATEAEARTLLRNTLGLDFRPGTVDEPASLDLVGFEFVLIVDHDFEDVPNIPFSRYPFALSILPAHRRLRPAYEAQLALATYVRDVLRTRGIDCITVDNVQRIVED